MTSQQRRWTLAVVLLALVVAVSMWVTRDEEADGPFATTPIAEARRMAPAKDLQVGLSYGARLMGMDERQLARSLDRVVRLGGTWVRTDLDWSAVELSPGSYDWSAFDRVVAAVQERGLHLLPILLHTPGWARRPSCADQRACPPRDTADFSRFAGEAAARYSSRGVRTWQVWNEPNIWLFWTRPDPRGYARLFKQGAAAIRRADPRATIVFGGLAALPPDDRVIEARAYLRQVCDLEVCGAMDVFAYHPYTYPYLPSAPADPDAAWNRIAVTQGNFLSILHGYGLDDVPVWLTEFGAPTGGSGRSTEGEEPLVPGVVDHTTERRQAQIAFDAVAEAVVTPRVRMLVWYTDVDLPGLDGKQAYYGLFRADGTPKPAWKQLKRAVRLFTKPPH